MLGLLSIMHGARNELEQLKVDGGSIPFSDDRSESGPRRQLPYYHNIHSTFPPRDSRCSNSRRKTLRVYLEATPVLFALKLETTMYCAKMLRRARCRDMDNGIEAFAWKDGLFTRKKCRLTQPLPTGNEAGWPCNVEKTVNDHTLNAASAIPIGGTSNEHFDVVGARPLLGQVARRLSGSRMVALRAQAWPSILSPMKFNLVLRFMLLRILEAVSLRGSLIEQESSEWCTVASCASGGEVCYRNRLGLTRALGGVSSSSSKPQLSRWDDLTRDCTRSGHEQEKALSPLRGGTYCDISLEITFAEDWSIRLQACEPHFAMWKAAMIYGVLAFSCLQPFLRNSTISASLLLLSLVFNATCGNNRANHSLRHGDRGSMEYSCVLTFSCRQSFISSSAIVFSLFFDVVGSPGCLPRRQIARTTSILHTKAREQIPYCNQTCQLPKTVGGLALHLAYIQAEILYAVVARP
ncbi:hypothetical protein EDD85DRAFT_981208 [Armillaria nabsnona]|nr:hypothetical protein EDD85DRAFT_981208 [Armillaria nabsnona]